MNNEPCPAFQAVVGVSCLCRRSLTCGYENSAFQAVWEAVFLPVRAFISIEKRL
ncbi:MAG: hypothetical protein LBS16_07400 [Prevotellaceae bacterium]|jgi:hypothetical protein|nr:hypothetical protein [Prevotellaceae bacterium]